MKTFQSRSPQEVVYHNAKPSHRDGLSACRIQKDFDLIFDPGCPKQNKTLAFLTIVSLKVCQLNGHWCRKSKIRIFFYSLLPLSDGGFLEVEVRCKYLATDVLKPWHTNAQASFVPCNSLLTLLQPQKCANKTCYLLFFSCRLEHCSLVQALVVTPVVSLDSCYH